MDPVTFQTIPKIESTVLPDDTELEKLADRAMRAIQLHNAFRKRMENKIKIREEAAKAAAEAARLAYERALAHLNAVYEANRVLEERLKISDSASESASTVYDQGDTKAEDNEVDAMKQEVVLWNLEGIGRDVTTGPGAEW